jgi:hypothetical protein
LDTKVLAAGTHTLTERTYYEDGSYSSRTQDITIKDTAAVTGKKSHGWIGPVIWVLLAVLVCAAAYFVARKVRLLRGSDIAPSTMFNSDEIIIAPGPPAPQQSLDGQTSYMPDDKNNLTGPTNPNGQN